MLLSAEAEIEAADIDGRTPLLVAVDTDRNSLEVVNALLQAAADPNAADAGGLTPLFRATEKEQLEDMKALLGAAAGPGFTNRTDRARVDTRVDDVAPIHRAAADAFTAGVRLLVRSGLDFPCGTRGVGGLGPGC